MSDQILQVPPNSTGLKMDVTELTVGSNTVERERVNIAGSAALALAEVTNAAPTTEYGLVTRNIPSGTQPVSGAVSFTAPQHVIADSGTVTAVTSITNPIHAIIDSSSDIEAVQDTAADLNATVVFASPQHVILDSGTVTAVTAITNALPAGSNVIGHVIADTGSTTAVTGNVTVIQGTATNLKVDASGVAVPITDNSGSLTVDNAGTFAVQAAIADGASVTLGAKADAKSTATDTTAITAMSVLKQISASVQAPPSQAVTNAGTFAVQATVAAGATNIAKAEDVASADGDVGVPAMAIQKATPADTGGTDGDYTMLQMSAGRLWSSTKIDTAIPAGSNVIGHVITDATSVTAATLSAETTKVIGVTRSADGAGNLLTSSSNALDINIKSGSIGNSSFAVTLAAGATAIAKAEDVASADADVGVPAMAVRKASPANTSGTDGDYEMLQISAGRLWASATIDAALPAGTNAIGKLSANGGVIIGDVNVVSNIPGTTATSLGKAEDAAHVTADTGVFVLAVRDDTLNATSGTEGDYEALHTNADGALWTSNYPSTTGGLSTFMASGSDGSTALTSTAQVLKASTGNVYGYYVYNPNSIAQFVHFYNVAAASVTVGTTAPLMSLTIPPTSAANLMGSMGINFSNAGFSIAATATAGGSGAPSTALDAVVWYK